jgi:hypothetical protein
MEQPQQFAGSALRELCDSSAENAAAISAAAARANLVQELQGLGMH